MCQLTFARKLRPESRIDHNDSFIQGKSSLHNQQRWTQLPNTSQNIIQNEASRTKTTPKNNAQFQWVSSLFIKCSFSWLRNFFIHKILHRIQNILEKWREANENFLIARWVYMAESGSIEYVLCILMNHITDSYPRHINRHKLFL